MVRSFIGSIRMSLLVLSGILLCCVMFAWWRLRPRLRSPPALPGALPLVGHGHQLIGDRKHLWNFFREIQIYSLRKGGVCEVFFGPLLYYIVTDPEDSLTMANSCFNKPYIYDFAKSHTKNGLVTAEASIWKTHRKLLNPAFNQQVLNTYIHEMNVQARSLVSQLASKVGKDPFDSRNYFIKFTLSTVTRTSLGLNIQDQTKISTDYAEAIDDLLAVYCERFQKLWLHLSYFFDWSALKRKQDQLTNKLKNITNPIIYKRKLELKAHKNRSMDDDATPGKFKPILDQLLHLAEEQDAFSDDDIREHLDTLVGAAYDTTASAMTLILILIGSHRDVQDRIYNELQEVLEHKDDDITKQDLKKLIYLEAVIKESMRMYPVVPIIARKVDKDVTLKNYTLRAGSTCGIGIYGLLHHPMWGADVDQFRPERWLDLASLPDHPSLNAAFSMGKRNCIGKAYSMMMMKTALAHIIRRYHVTGDINKVVCEFDVVLKPVEGHLIGLTLRT